MDLQFRLVQIREEHTSKKLDQLEPTFFNTTIAAANVVQIAS